ncbi:hypothetical protein QF028_004424 [Neobacillus sp. B4I6]
MCSVTFEGGLRWKKLFIVNIYLEELLSKLKTTLFL